MKFLSKFLAIFFIFTILFSCKQKESSTKAYETESDTEVIAMTTPVNAKLPVDVKPTCVVSSSDLSNWFVSGSITENGAVHPANSVTFGHKNNCDFYKWSEQMFLWMTSPSEGDNYTNGTIFESPVFYTVSPKVNGQRTLIPHEQGKLISAVANTQKNDSLVDTEEGQATDDVLMDQNGSLLYYITMVNDVYAEFLTGVDNGELSGKEFPTTATALDSIVDYAAQRGVTLSDPNALTIEVKTSWTEVDNLSNADSYITIDAIVPTYEKTDSIWTPNGSKETKLAMLGLHIVGSTNGHPEMVWATFEHTNNAPNLSYGYVDSSGETKTVAADTGNDWLLNSDSSSSDYNQSHMTYTNSNGSIQAKKGLSISASNSTKTKPWGVAEAGVPNPENATGAESNTQVLSINNSVLGQLLGNDIRKNYVFIGATWTDGGAGPNGESYSVTNTTPGVAIGTSQLANSTMETYAQNGTAYSKGFGTCFACHSNNGSLAPKDISHVFDEIQPLFSATESNR